jgi:3-oxoacyl-[acyl-carrier protein] reductase
MMASIKRSSRKLHESAEEFANLACFLASEQGSYITGAAINVDGGRSPVV